MTILSLRKYNPIPEIILKSTSLAIVNVNSCMIPRVNILAKSDPPGGGGVGKIQLAKKQGRNLSADEK